MCVYVAAVPGEGILRISYVCINEMSSMKKGNLLASYEAAGGLLFNFTYVCVYFCHIFLFFR